MSNLKLFNSMSGMQKQFSQIKEAKKSAAMQGYEMYRGSHVQTYEQLKAEFETKKKTIEDKIADTKTTSKLPEQVKDRKIKKLETELENLIFEYEGGTTEKGTFPGKLTNAEKKSRGAERQTKGQKHGAFAAASKIKKDLEKKINPLIIPVKAEGMGKPGQLTFSDMLSIAARDIDISEESSEDLIKYRDAIDGINKLINICMITFKKKIKKGSELFADKEVLRVINTIIPNDTTVTRIERSSDLIKLFWIYLNGEEAFAKAKKREPFLAALKKLESKNTSKITKPIEDAVSADDMIIYPQIKTAFDHIKTFITTDANAPSGAAESLANKVNDILWAPDALYSGFSVSTSENIADTLYYSLISAFGTPEDAVLLLKRSGGSVGKTGKNIATSKFLSKEALEALALKVKQLATEQEEFKPQPSAGRMTDWGARNVNKTYEKYRGGKMLSVLGGKFLKSATTLSDIETEEVEAIVGQVFKELSSSLQEKKPELEQRIKELSQKVRELSTPGANLISSKMTEIFDEENADADISTPELRTALVDKKRAALELNTDKEENSRLRAEAIKEIESENNVNKKALADAKEELAGYASGSKHDVKDLFINQVGSSDFLSHLKDIFMGRLDVILTSLNLQIAKAEKQAEKLHISAGLDKDGNPLRNKFDENADMLKNVAEAAKVRVYAILDTFNSLEVKDLEQLKSLFMASSASPEEETTPQSLRPLKYAMKKLLPALEQYSKQAPGTVNKDLTEVNLEKRIEKIRVSIAQVNKDLLTSEEDSDTLLKNELATLTKQFNDAQEELDNYRAELKKMGLVVKSVGNKRISGSLTLRLKKLLADDNFDVSEAKSILSNLPADVYQYTGGNAVIEKAHEIVNSLLGDAGKGKNSEWKARVRNALYALSHYANSAEFKENETRKKALTLLATPFVSELEEVSDYSEPEAEDGDIYTDEKAQEDRINGLKAHLQKLTRASKPATRTKKALRKQERINKRLLSNLSIIPGTALSGEATIVPDESLISVLFKNAKNLDASARVFYTNILNFVNDSNIPEQLAGTDKLFSTDNPEFLDGMLQLIRQYKQNLSTDISAADLEDTLFLNKLLDKVSTKAGTKEEQEKASASEEERLAQQEKEKGLTDKEKEELRKNRRLLANRSAILDADAVKTSLLGSDNFKEFMSNLNKSVEDNTIWYQKKVINAPLIAGLGLKSATLLNIMSSIKNFESLQSFDMSLNKGNKNVLTSLLDIVNYPKIFTKHTSTSLMMKLFFLTRLKAAVVGADVIGNFSGDFIDVSLKLEDDEPDKAVEEIMANVKKLNGIFEQSTLSEFKADFSDGGTLDNEIEDTLALLWEVINNSGGNLYSIDLKTGSAIEIPVSEESLKDTAIEEGKNCVAIFSAGLTKQNLPLEKLLSLFDRSREQDLINQLKNTISIVQTGINFWVGYEALKTISEYQLYDESTKQLDRAEVSRRLADFKKAKRFEAFVNPFKSTQDVIQKTDETGKKIETKLNTFTTAAAKPGDKDGFINLNDNFLSAFTSEFIWEALKSPVEKIEKEKLEKTNIENLVAADKTEKEEKEAGKETKKNLNKIVEEKFDVFFAGIFKKRSGTTSEKVIDLYTPEAEKKLAAKLSRDLSKAEELLKTGKAKEFTPYDIIPHVNEAGQESLGLVVTITKDNGYSNLVGNTNKTDSIAFGEDIIGFSSGLEKVARSLSKVYSNYPELVKEINDYVASIKTSAELAVSAVATIKDSAYNEEAQTIALEKLSQMPAKPAPSDGVKELTEPTKVYNAAIKSFMGKDSPYYEVYEFAESAAKDIQYKNVNISQILSALNAALRNPAAFASAEFPKNFDETSDKSVDEKRLLNREEIEKYSNLLFTRLFGKENKKEKKSQEQVSFETILNILNTIKDSLGELKKDDTVDKRKEAHQDKIKELKDNKEKKSINLERARETVKAILEALGKNPEDEQEFAKLYDPSVEQVPAKYLPRTAPANAPKKAAEDMYAELSPEQATGNVRKDIEQSITAPIDNPAGFLTKPIPVQEPKEEKETIFPAPEWNWLTGKTPIKEDVEAEETEQIAGVEKGESLTAALKRYKQRIFTLESEILELDKEIAQAEENLVKFEHNETNVAMVVFLTELYSKAVDAFTAVKTKLTNINIKAISDTAYELEFKPVAQGVSSTIAFIKQLKASAPGSDLADKVLESFSKLEKDIKDYQRPEIKEPEKKQEVKKESVSVRAVEAFKRLLEATEEVQAPINVPEVVEEPTQETKTTEPEISDTPVNEADLSASSYILSMAKYLKEKQRVNKAEEWTIFGSKPGETIKGTENAIQNACMIQLIGDSKSTNSVFKELKEALSSKIALGFTVKPTMDEITEREDIYLHITELDIAAKVASNDLMTIVGILHPELLKD